MQNRSAASTLLPTLSFAALVFGLRAIFPLLGRRRHPQTQIPEFITLALAGGVLYLASVFLVERHRTDSAGLLIILLGALTFRLHTCTVTDVSVRVTGW